MIEITEDQERWGAMVALLSLDEVFPFYSYMGLNITDPKKFKELLREAILSNREEFIKNPTQVPDLQKRVLEAMELTYGTAAAKALMRWYKESFVWFPNDAGDYVPWKCLFSTIFYYPDELKKLVLPEKVWKVLKHNYDDSLLSPQNPLTIELNAMSDKLNEQPHSKWDIEIYTLNGFDDHDQEPYEIGVNAVIHNRREKAFLKWLFSQLNENERKEFVKSANDLVNNVEKLDLIWMKDTFPQGMVVPADIDK